MSRKLTACFTLVFDDDETAHKAAQFFKELSNHVAESGTGGAVHVFPETMSEADREAFEKAARAKDQKGIEKALHLEGMNARLEAARAEMLGGARAPAGGMVN